MADSQRDAQPNESTPRQSRKAKLFVGILATLVALAFLVAWAMQNTPVVVSPEMTIITSPLLPNGMPDYLAVLNEEQSRGVTPENNAAVLLVVALGPDSVLPEYQREEVMRQMGVPPIDPKAKVFEDLDDYVISKSIDLDDADKLIEGLCSRPWKASDHPEVAQWLDEMQQPLDLVVQASHRPRYFVPLVSPGTTARMLGALLPNLSRHRSAAKALQTRAVLRAEQGDFEGAWLDVLAIYRLGSLIQSQQSLIGRMVGLLITRMACEATCTLAADGRVPVATLKQWLADLRELPPARRDHDWLRYDQFGFIDCVIALNKDPASRGEITRDHINHYAEDWNQVLRVGNEYYAQLDRAMRLPTLRAQRVEMDRLRADVESARIRQTERWTSKAKVVIGSRDAATWMLGVLTLSLGRVPESQAGGDARQRIALLAVALALHKAEHGGYPATPDELVPGCLPDVPVDPFSDKPLVYKRTSDGYRLYSVGPNMTDDGGESDDSGTGRDDIAAIVPLPAKPAKTQTPASRPSSITPPAPN